MNLKLIKPISASNLPTLNNTRESIAEFNKNNNTSKKNSITTLIDNNSDNNNVNLINIATRKNEFQSLSNQNTIFNSESFNRSIKNHYGTKKVVMIIFN